MIINKLSDTQCRNSKPGTKLWDGGGLYLHTADSGRATWRQKFRLGCKQRIIVHGVYPAVKLSEARVLRDSTKKLIAAGVDPVQQRRVNRKVAVERGAATVERYATDHYEAIRDGHRNAKHSRQWISSLKPLFDKLGTRALVDVTTTDLVAVIAPVLKRTPETGRRMRQRIKQIFAAALEDELIERDPAVSLHTNKRLQLSTRIEPRHFTALPWNEVPAFLITLRGYPVERISVSARAALEFAIITAARTGEVLGAKWDEIHEDGMTWTIPGHRMKMGRTHVVPLTERARSVLQEVKAMSGGEGYVFPSPRNPRRPLSNMALLMVIRRLGYTGKATAHGFRSAFSSWAYEQTHFREDVIEMALAHVSANKVKSAYLRSDFLADRVALMQSWASYIGQSAEPAEVVGDTVDATLVGNSVMATRDD